MTDTDATIPGPNETNTSNQTSSPGETTQLPRLEMYFADPYRAIRWLKIGILL